MRAPEEIFAVLIFAAPACTGKRGDIDVTLAAIFAVFVFAEANLCAKNVNFEPRKSSPLYGISAKHGLYRGESGQPSNNLLVKLLHIMPYWHDFLKCNMGLIDTHSHTHPLAVPLLTV